MATPGVSKIVEWVDTFAIEQGAVGEVGDLVIPGHAKAGAQLGEVHGGWTNGKSGSSEMTQAPEMAGKNPQRALGPNLEDVRRGASTPETRGSGFLKAYSARPKADKQTFFEEEAARAVEVASGRLAGRDVRITPSCCSGC